jgi:predicted tellurium resistance membrane protein TerC
MAIIEIIATIMVFGMVLGVSILKLHLDELTELVVDFLYVVAAAVVIFLFVGLSKRWF